MNPLDNYIEEGLLNRKNHAEGLVGETILDELRKCSDMGWREINNYGTTSPWKWKPGSVTWNNSLGGIRVQCPANESVFMLTHIKRAIPITFNIADIDMPKGKVLICDCDITTTKGLFSPDCKANIKKLEIIDNEHLTRLEDLPQHVNYFEYWLGKDVQKETDPDKIFKGIPRWCEELSIGLGTSAIADDYVKKELGKDPEVDMLTLSENCQITEYLHDLIIKYLDKSCPAAVRKPTTRQGKKYNLSENISVWWDR